MKLDNPVLVTGANGFIGSHLVQRLAGQEGVRVRGLVRRPYPLTPGEGVEYCLGDVTDAAAVAAAARDCDIIIHTAALQPFKPLPSRAQFERVNVGGVLNLLQAFRPHGDGRLLLLSTINVHGLPPPSGADADSPLYLSGDRYSDSKAKGERAALAYAREHHIPITIIRPACTFGPGSTAWTRQPIERIRRGTPVLIGDGHGICNPVYIDNLVELIVAAIKSDAAQDQAFIGSDGRGIEWREFFGYYARWLGKPLRSVPLPAARLAGVVSTAMEGLTGSPGPLSRPSVAFYTHRMVFDVSKNEKLLGHTPRISFEEGMQRTADWCRQEKLI